MTSPATADDFCPENPLRAIQNEYILEYLFSFLSLDVIKNCRLVNRAWRNIGTKILKRRAHVLFDFRGGAVDNLEKINQMKEVSDYCKENTPENSPISSFVFDGTIEYLPLFNFLDDVCSYMKKLKITSILYRKENEGNEVITVDISPKIPPHLTKLHIDVFNRSDVKYRNFVISLCFDQLSFVTDIYVDGCTIVLNGNGKRLSPSHVTLGPRNTYIKNGAKVEFLVNECFDLTLTKQIFLNGNNLIVDFSDCANDQVERTVTLMDITVRNWEMCNWKIKKFSLYKIPFLDKNFIEMEELTADYSRIDLSKIYKPTSLLKLYCDEDTTITEAPFFLPSLADVSLRCGNCIAKLPYFTNNKNISEMWLHQEDDDDAMSVNINDLPKGINELRLSGVGVHGEGVYQLPSLHMNDNYKINDYEIVGAKFRPETFRIHSNSIVTDDDEDTQSVIRLLNLGDSYGRLEIGPFFWNGFHNSVISNYVDKEEEYYVFEGKRGRGITKEEAEKEFGYMCCKIN